MIDENARSKTNLLNFRNLRCKREQTVSNFIINDVLLSIAAYTTSAGAQDASSVESISERRVNVTRLVRCPKNNYETVKERQKKTMAVENVLTAKIVTMVSLFGISMFVGCLPLLISKKFNWFTKSRDPNLRSSNQLVMGLLAFGGGVLFATTFMHLLPEVDENIELLQGKFGANTGQT